MCGITGFVDFRNNSSCSILREMTNTLVHRGPDGEGVYFKEAGNFQVGLGHRRLSIIDLSNGAAQPMSFDGLEIVYNGEIYNYKEIKQELINLGHSFISNSDTEVILHSYREWGLKAIERWKGMFAIAIFDERENEVICIRDRAGVKPFNYYWSDEVFIFGSEFKSLIKHPAFSRVILPSSLNKFLQFGYIPSPDTIFKNTFKLLPGQLLRFNLTSREIKKIEYWNVFNYYKKPKLNISLEDAILETELVLKRSFDYRMVSDVPVGVFLSGGFDSACVATLLQKDRTEKLKTFTIGIENKKYDEAYYAAQVAERLGTDHSEYLCTAREALSVIPELPKYFDEPFADSSSIPTILVSRLARRKVTVALSADGGDEVFAGYNKYKYLLTLNKRLSLLPESFKLGLSNLLSGISSSSIPFFNTTYNFHSRFRKLKSALRERHPGEMMQSISKVFSNEELSRLTGNINVNENIVKDYSNRASDLLSFMMASDYQDYLPNDILQKVDRSTMSIGLEGREPFLDEEIIQWAAQLPSSYKFHNGEKKYLIKQIVYKYLPKDLMDRPKMGFSIPIHDWLRNELRDLVFDNLNEKNIQHELFNKKEVEILVQSFMKGKNIESYEKIWHLLVFQMWYKRWMSS